MRARFENLIDVLLLELARGILLGIEGPIGAHLQQQVDLFLVRQLARACAVDLTAHGGEHGLIQPELLAGPLKHLRLIGAARHQPTHFHLLGLADAVHACLRLNVVLRVPVAVVDDDGVCYGQVDAQTAGARRQQKHKAVRVRRTEAVDGLLTLGAAL